jgi:hypothetical protein
MHTTHHGKGITVRPTSENTKTPCTATGIFALLRGPLRTQGRSAPRSVTSALLASLTTLVCCAVALPTTAGAYTTIEGPPIFSSAPGLPDGRVYEQVSPTDKNGNSAGFAITNHATNLAGEQHYAIAAPDGNSVLFEGSGSMGESASALSKYFVASKNQEATGWSTRAVTPAPQQRDEELGGALYPQIEYLDPSADLSHVMFEPRHGRYATLDAHCGVHYIQYTNAEEGGYQLYLAGSDPFVPATWLERPEIEDPLENCASQGEAGVPAGGTPDFSTVYFTYPGTLLPEDASRASHTVPKNEPLAEDGVEAWGFYEDREGVLREAGVLPDGLPSEYGAVPAASGEGKAIFGNQVSSAQAPDGAPAGSRAFFVSPDPASCAGTGIGTNDCTADPPELYVRENGEKTLLVSQDTLLPTVGGLPASAPAGALPIPNLVAPEQRRGPYLSTFRNSYVFASPDGSQAFFQSASRLTASAPESGEPNTYDFDVDTGELTYLPDVAGQILTTDEHGSAFAFVRPEAGGTPAQLDLWSAGPTGGSVVPIAPLTGALSSLGQYVSEARLSADGSALAFQTGSPLSSAFNNGGFEQIYRYDIPTNTLGCVSCPPHGVTPSGNASMSSLRANEKLQQEDGNHYSSYGMVDGRGLSADGERIFFETPDPLVPQDVNTGTTVVRNIQGVVRPVVEGGDVYEWENGVVYLISSGKSTFDSIFLDSSENGDDVFFATTDGFVPGDTDGAYDVYDARVPHPGDNPPPAAVPCEGSVCQGPPNVPAPLAPPASATFSGLGNPSSEPTATPPPPKTTTRKTVKCARGKKLSRGKCLKVRSKKQAKKSNRGAE